MQDMRHRVKQQHGLASVASLHAGVVTVVQRFRSDLGLYVHLHCLATDGAYEEQNDGELRFLAAPPPPPPRMTAVLAQVHEVIRAADDDLDLDPALAACLQLSLAGPRPAPDSPSAPPPMTLSAFGMNLHAATTADGRDRKQLARICRYLLRPPFAHDAVTALSSSPTSSGSVAARSRRSASSATSTRSSTDVGIRSTALTPARSRDKRRGQERSGERAGRTASMRQHPGTIIAERAKGRRAARGAVGAQRERRRRRRTTDPAAPVARRAGRRAARGTVGRPAGPAPPCCSARATTTGGERNCWPTRDRGATAELLDARARGDGRVERLVGPPVRRPLLLG
jgi:hypothetical protein